MQQPRKIPDGIKDMPIEQKDHLLDASRQALGMICDIGSDYDGERSVEGLRGLVDELVELAVDGLRGVRPQYMNGNGKWMERVFGEWKEVPEDRIKK